MILDNEYELRETAKRYKVMRVVVGHHEMTCNDYSDVCDVFNSGYADMLNKTFKDRDYAEYYYIVYGPEDGKNVVYDAIEKTEAFLKKYKAVVKFGRDERSTFRYWFAHWCSFQVVALNLGLWKFKYLLHDFEKPWLRLFVKYKTVQTWHRWHNKHHLEYGLRYGFDKVDWEALMIDWECSRFSKEQCPRDCRAEMENKLADDKWKGYAEEIRSRLEPLLDKYNI